MEESCDPIGSATFCYDPSVWRLDYLLGGEGNYDHLKAPYASAYVAHRDHEPGSPGTLEAAEERLIAEMQDLGDGLSTLERVDMGASRLGNSATFAVVYDEDTGDAPPGIVLTSYVTVVVDEAGEVEMVTIFMDLGQGPALSDRRAEVHRGLVEGLRRGTP